MEAVLQWQASKILSYWFWLSPSSNKSTLEAYWRSSSQNLCQFSVGPLGMEYWAWNSRLNYAAQLISWLRHFCRCRFAHKRRCNWGLLWPIWVLQSTPVKRLVAWSMLGGRWKLSIWSLLPRISIGCTLSFSDDASTILSPGRKTCLSSGQQPSKWPDSVFGRKSLQKPISFWKDGRFSKACSNSSSF